MSTALVLAGPERRRILRELLSKPWPLSLEDQDLYRSMLMAELRAIQMPEFADVLAEAAAKQEFHDSLLRGVPIESARQQAQLEAEKAARQYKREKSLGRQERRRRRTFREAVTAADGALAVTTGMVEWCIVCGGPFHWTKLRRRVREDAAYCSAACKQKAYRKRKAAQ